MAVWRAAGVLVAAAAVASGSVAAPALVDVRATLAGTVLAERLVAVGDQVEDGQPLVYVRTALTGTVAVAARAPVDGIVREVLVHPGQSVERGQVVVRLQPR